MPLHSYEQGQACDLLGRQEENFDREDAAVINAWRLYEAANNHHN